MRADRGKSRGWAGDALRMGSPKRRMAALERAMAGSPVYKNLFSGR